MTNKYGLIVSIFQFLFQFIEAFLLGVASGRLGFFCYRRGMGTTLKLGGTSPGVQGNPYPKIKNPRIWPTSFGRDLNPRAKTNTNKNERH